MECVRCQSLHLWLVLAKHKNHKEHQDFWLCYSKNVLFLSFEPNAAYKIQLLYTAVQGQYVFKVNSASDGIENLEFSRPYTTGWESNLHFPKVTLVAHWISMMLPSCWICIPENGNTSNVVQWTWVWGVWPYNPNTFSHMIRPQFLTLLAHSLIVLQFLSLITHMQFVHHLLSPNTESELPQLYTDETSLCGISLHLTADSITHTVISSTIKPFTPPLNPTPHLYLRVTWIHIQVYSGSCGRR